MAVSIFCKAIKDSLQGYAQQVCLWILKVSEESLGRDETRVRLATNISQVFN